MAKSRLSKPTKKNVQRIKRALTSSGTTSPAGAQKYVTKLRKQLRSPGGSRSYEKATVVNLRKITGNDKLANAVKRQFKAQDKRSTRQANSGANMLKPKPRAKKKK